MKLLLTYLPHHLPIMPPYALGYLNRFLSVNSTDHITTIDLNARWWQTFHPNILQTIRQATSDEELTVALQKAANIQVSPDIHWLQEQCKNFDLICASIQYTEQDKLANQLNIKIRGGPAASNPMHEFALLDMLTKKESIDEHQLTSFDFNQGEYCSDIIPLRTSTACWYRKCRFCTHYNYKHFFQFPLEDIASNISSRHLFFTDDMIAHPYLLKLAPKLLNHEWWIQLRPTLDITSHLQSLKNNGLKVAAWGVESGSQHILDAMDKGTRIDEISHILKKSKEAGIINIVYIMFGYPGETDKDRKQTISWLQDNANCIDLLSSSLFVPGGIEKRPPAISKIPQLPKIGTIDPVFNNFRELTLNIKRNFL
ncbi:radical SAM protein [Candidatus Woesearchaeota archaeon]|nr:radical SAM protein [Candidatus Woesearchaeota archaeon]